MSDILSEADVLASITRLANPVVTLDALRAAVGLEHGNMLKHHLGNLYRHGVIHRRNGESVCYWTPATDKAASRKNIKATPTTDPLRTVEPTMLPKSRSVVTTKSAASARGPGTLYNGPMTGKLASTAFLAYQVDPNRWFTVEDMRTLYAVMGHGLITNADLRRCLNTLNTPAGSPHSPRPPYLGGTELHLAQVIRDGVTYGGMTQVYRWANNYTSVYSKNDGTFTLAACKRMRDALADLEPHPLHVVLKRPCGLPPIATGPQTVASTGEIVHTIGGLDEDQKVVQSSYDAQQDMAGSPLSDDELAISATPVVDEEPEVDPVTREIAELIQNIHVVESTPEIEPTTEVPDVNKVPAPVAEPLATQPVTEPKNGDTTDIRTESLTERVARAIYSELGGADLHPWKTNGSSILQGLARDYANAALAVVEADQKADTSVASNLNLGERLHAGRNAASQAVLHATLRASGLSEGIVHSVIARLPPVINTGDPFYASLDVHGQLFMVHRGYRLTVSADHTRNLASLLAPGYLMSVK